MRQKIMKYSLLVCLMLGMSFSLVYNLLYAIRPDQKPGFIFITIAGCMLIAIAFGTSIKTFVISLLVFVIGGVVLGFYLYSEGLLVTVYWRIVFFIRRNQMLLGMSLLVTWLVYFFTIKKIKWFIPVGVGSIFCGLYIIQKFPMPTLGIESFIFMSLCYYFYHYYEKMHSKAKSYAKSMGIFMSIVLGLTYISAYIVPIKFTFLHNLFDKEAHESRTYRYSEYYPYTGRLGGDLTLDDKEILNVVAPSQTYLRGGTKAVYTGHGWTNYEEEANQFFIGSHALKDTQEALLGSKLLSQESFEKLFEGSAYRITYKDIRTRSLFVPPKMNNLAVSRNGYSVYCENEDTLFLDYPYGRGFIYVVQSYIPRYKSPYFEEAMKKSQPGLYKEAKIMGKDPFAGELDVFIERADFIRECYTQLPKSVTDRVRELAKMITKDYQTPYEKVRAIEAYLAGNYTYTLTPGEASRTQDFVDQFLFETKEGYCTYFATAMAVLTRCIGIPSRYVEGYVIPEESSGGENNYTVTSREAHAWVEVYFEGMGWAMFEPTASYQSDLRGYMNSQQDTYYVQPLIEERTRVDRKDPIPRQNIQLDYRIYVTGIGGIIGILILLRVGIYIHKYRRMKKMSPNGAICYFYHLSLKELYCKGYAIEPGETEIMYASRMDELFEIEFLTMMMCTEIYLKAQYSLVELSIEEVKMMRQFYKQCRKKLKFREKQD